jgi:hypothetical protein
MGIPSILTSLKYNVRPAPKEILRKVGWKIGDNCIIGIDGNKIVIIKESEPEIE